METIQSSTRIHPMMAGAAASVMLVSLLGAAAIAGILPNSRGNDAETARNAAQAAGLAAPAPTLLRPVASTPADVSQVAQAQTAAPPHYAQQAATPRARPVHVARAEPVHHYSSTPAYQPAAPVAQNSPLGIGVGAVIGGLLGSQVGGGNGRTLAAIAGAVGGGYAGNEIAKRNP
jgi:uncharacterized protein YcfJ